MRRYIDFQRESWPDRTSGRMRAARWEACVSALGSDAPCAGVMDTLPIDLLGELIGEGWVDVPPAPSDLLYRRAARRSVMATLADDADCLAPEEHALVERMLIGDGCAFLDTVASFEAAYTLRYRLWCDVGIDRGQPCARLDTELMEALPALFMRNEHAARRARVFVYDGMLRGLLYIAGFLDDRPPRERFVREVLEQEPSPAALRLARNYIEAAFDCFPVAGGVLLLHGDLAAPESLVGSLAQHSAPKMPAVTAERLVGSMNELLPEESFADTKLRLALSGALRPDYEPQEAARDLRMLAKQGAPLPALRRVMAQMLCVLPTRHMESALTEMSGQTPRWISPWEMGAPFGMAGGFMGVLH